MRSSARSALPALLTCLCFAASLSAQSPNKLPVKTPRASVSGRITIKDKPVPGVVVGLRKSALENSYDPFDRAVTDAEGMYRISNVPAGSYVITIAALAYVPTDSVDRKPVVVGEDENVEDVNFSLVRGGVITGKVTDAEGHPVILHQVELFRAAELERVQKTLPYPAMTAQTDDRGVYRLFGILPGRYKVAAGRGNEGFYGYSPTELNYKQAFHPDAANPANGNVIDVSAGSEAKDIDITLGRPVQAFSVSGRVINADTSAPVANLRFSLRRADGNRTEYVSISALSNARGDFILEGLIPGKYSTVVFPREGDELRAEVTTFEVIDADLSGLTIKLTRGATISGFVIIESENKAAIGRVAEMTVRGSLPVPQTGTGSGNPAAAQIGADGSFRLTGLGNGPVTITLSGKGNPYPPKGFSILRVERDGVPAPRIEVKDAEQVTGVKVFVGYGTATIRGVVKIENGSLSANGRIYVYLMRPGEENSNFRWIMVDDRGNFLVEGVPPGQYEVNVSVMDGRVRKSVKQPVSVTDGVVTDVRIPVDVATPANP